MRSRLLQNDILRPAGIGGRWDGMPSGNITTIIPKTRRANLFRMDSGGWYLS